MDKQTEGAAGDDKSSCGRGRCYCGTKAIGAVVLLLLGGIIGFLIGRCGGMNAMCGPGYKGRMFMHPPITGEMMQEPPAAPQK